MQECDAMEFGYCCVAQTSSRSFIFMIIITIVIVIAIDILFFQCKNLSLAAGIYNLQFAM